MPIHNRFVSLFAAITLGTFAPVSTAGPTVCSFQDGVEATPYEIMRTGRGQKPQPFNDGMRLLHGRANTSGAVVFEQTEPGLHRTIKASWLVSIPEGPGGDGGSLLLLDTAQHGDSGEIELPSEFSWDEPNLEGSFAIAIDIRNPPGGDPFNAPGNIYDRPQREISLHWNGREIRNRLCPVLIRTGEAVAIDCELRYEPGGAVIDLSVEGTPVYQGEFLPGVTAFETRAALGAQSGDFVTEWDIDEVRIEYIEPMASPMPEPVRASVFRKEFVSSKNQRPKSVADFRRVPRGTARVIATLTLEEPDVGFDPWDKSAAVYIWDESGERHELLRFITPFGRGWQWQVDVTQALPLLEGRPEMGLWIDTYRKGWLVSFDLDFYPALPGEAYEMPVSLHKLWSGKPEIGNPEKPVSEFYEPAQVQIPQDADRAHFEITTTGHGMSPNSLNAGEFMPIDRTFSASGPGGSVEETNTLWKEDVYLNPCRPQGGTWKYDRAGWSPGDVVTPWTVDLTEVSLGAQDANGTLDLNYQLAPYLNEGRGKTWSPFHWTEARVVFWKTVQP